MLDDCKCCGAETDEDAIFDLCDKCEGDQCAVCGGCELCCECKHWPSFEPPVDGVRFHHSLCASDDKFNRQSVKPLHACEGDACPCLEG